MDEYIKVPNWLNLIERFESEYINDVQIDDGFIDIAYLWSFYKSNRSLFRTFVDELALRGFEFVSEKANNMLPKTKYRGFEPYIYISKNDNIHRNIDFEKLGIADFLIRFKVSSDMFFNYVPIRGFIYLNPNLTEDICLHEFKKAGFDIITNFKGAHKFSFGEIDIRKNNDSTNMMLGEIENKILEVRNNTKIEYIFRDNRFNKFLSLCKKAGIDNVYEIKKNHINQYVKMKNSRSKIADEIREKVEHYHKYLDKFCKKKITIRDQVLKIYGAINVKKILSSYEKMFLVLNIEKIIDLNNFEFGALMDNGFDMKDIIDIQDKLMALKTLDEKIDEIKLDQRSYKCLYYRYNEGLTFDEIREKIGENRVVSKQRIRQIIEKAVRRINVNLINSGFLKYLKILTSNEICISYSKFSSYINEEHEFFLRICEQQKCLLFDYFEPLEVFFICKGEEFRRNLEKIITGMPQVFNLIDYLDIFRQLFEQYQIENIDLEKIENMLDKYGLSKYGDFFSIKKLTLVQILEIIFKNYITGPLKFDEQGYEKCKKISKEILNYPINSSLRALDGRLRDVENVILVNPKTFQHISTIEYSIESLELAHNLIEKQRGEREEINIDEIFNPLRDELKKGGIYSKYVLYSLMQKHYEDEYDIGKGRTLNIYFSKEKQKVTITEQLEKYLELHGGIASKEKIQQHFNWNRKRVNNAVINQPIFVSLGETMIKLVKKFEITEIQKKQLDDLVEKKLRQGYFTTPNMLDDMRYDLELNNILLANEIDTTIHLSHFLKNIYKNLVGHNLVLFDRKQKYRTVEEIVIDRFTDKTSKREIIEFYLKFSYPETSALTQFYNLLKKEIFIEISHNEVILKNKMNIEDRVVQAVFNYIQPYFEGKEYLSLNSLYGYQNKLPKINFKWNPFILKYALEKCGYRAIKKLYSDIRFEKIIMVRCDSDIQTFEELIYYILVNEYKGNWQETKFHEFLAEKKVISFIESKYSKKLPYEIRNSKLLKINEIGRIELVGDKNKVK